MINLSKKLKFALLSLFVLPTMAQVEQVKKPYGYLYCHMSRKGEWTAFALSRDGLNWHDLNNGNEIYNTKQLSQIEGGRARCLYCTRGRRQRIRYGHYRHVPTKESSMVELWHKPPSFE